MNLIVDHDELQKFIDLLPDLEYGEKYYFSLFARKKYCPELIKSNDKTQLQRFICRKEDIIRKITQLEGRIWYLKDVEAPVESLVLYMMPNPRSTKKAVQRMAKRSIDFMVNTNWDCNLVAESLSCYQKSKSRSCFVDFDIDVKDIDLSLLDPIVSKEARIIVQSRGGYHILVRPDIASQHNRKWHPEMMKTFPAEMAGDMLLPVPGCVQGGFSPKIINI